MEDLRKRINILFEEIIYVRLQVDWVEKLVVAGVKPEEAMTWAVEIGHAIDEYRLTMVILTELLSQEMNPETIPEKIYDWVTGVRSLSISEIDEPLQRLESALEKYIPPDEDEE